MSNVLEEDGFIVSQDDEIFGPRGGGNGFLASADSVSTTNTAPGGGVFTVQAINDSAFTQNSGFSVTSSSNNQTSTTFLGGTTGAAPFLNFNTTGAGLTPPPPTATTSSMISTQTSSNMSSATRSSGLNTSAPAFIPGGSRGGGALSGGAGGIPHQPAVYRLPPTSQPQQQHHHHQQHQPQLTANGNPAPLSIQRIVQPDGSKSAMVVQGTLQGATHPDFGEGAEGDLLVIDPMSRKIEIPRKSIMLSKAILREGIPSLCMLFMENRCRQGSECNQIHADPTLVLQIRQEAASLPTCCQHHGDVNKHMFDKHPEWKNRSILVDGVVIPIQFAAYTQGLERSMTLTNYNPQPNGEMGVTVSVSPTFVCRLQAGGHCRYSDECKFVHLCREVTAQHLSHCVIPLSSDVEKKHKQFAPMKLGVPSSALGGQSAAGRNNTAATTGGIVTQQMLFHQPQQQLQAHLQTQQQNSTAAAVAPSDGSFTVSSTPATTSSVPEARTFGSRGGRGGSRGAPPTYVQSTSPTTSPQQQPQQPPAAQTVPAQPTVIVVQGGGALPAAAAAAAAPTTTPTPDSGETGGETSVTVAAPATPAAPANGSPSKPAIITVNTGGANISPEVLSQIAQMVSANNPNGAPQQIIIQQ